jgi:hypothetical protein
MPTEVFCPTCGTKITIFEHLRVRQSRCIRCGASLAAVLDPPPVREPLAIEPELQPAAAAETVPTWSSSPANLSQDIVLGIPELLAVAGSFLCIIAVFLPAMNVIILGSVSFWQAAQPGGAPLPGLLVLALAVAAAVCAFTRHYQLLLGAAIGIAVTAAGVFVWLMSVISEAKQDAGVRHELVHAFAGRVIGLSWGWTFFVFGLAALFAAGYLGHQRAGSQRRIRFSVSAYD